MSQTASDTPAPIHIPFKNRDAGSRRQGISSIITHNKLILRTYWTKAYQMIIEQAFFKLCSIHFLLYFHFPYFFQTLIAVLYTFFDFSTLFFLILSNFFVFYFTFSLLKKKIYNATFAFIGFSASAINKGRKR